jgi:hypothetical protein
MDRGRFASLSASAWSESGSSTRLKTGTTFQQPAKRFERRFAGRMETGRSSVSDSGRLNRPNRELLS